MAVKAKSYVVHVVLILIMTYAMSSFAILGLAVGLVPYLPMAYLNPKVCTTYAVIGFLLAAGLGIYHLSTMIRTKKRKTDKLGVTGLAR
jgi:predicted membrane protein